MEKLYVTCPVCGATQGKSGEGTNTEADCKKCKAKLSYEVKNDTVLVHVVSPSPKNKVRPA